jgi:hypothetical protein
VMPAGVVAVSPWWIARGSGLAAGTVRDPPEAAIAIVVPPTTSNAAATTTRSRLRVDNVRRSFTAPPVLADPT